MKIELGDKVKCKLTGFVGTTVAKTEFINGCVQWEVVPKVGKDNKIIEAIGIDEQSLEIVTQKKKLVKKTETGGAMKKGLAQRGF